MHLFYIPDISSDTQLLPPEESAHCIKVLRLKKGDTVYLTDGIGGLYQTEIIIEHPKKCILQVIKSKKEVGKNPFVGIVFFPEWAVYRREDERMQSFQAPPNH